MPNPYSGNQTALVRVPDPPVPALVGDATSILEKIKATGTPLVFQTKDLDQTNDVTLVPLYRANHERYTVYWNLVSAADAKKRTAALSSEAELALRKALDDDGWQ